MFVSQFHSYLLLRSAHSGARFARLDYFAALRNAPFMVSYTPGENYANFLQEAKSFDVPVFLISGHKPEWFTDRKDGAFFHSQTPLRKLTERFQEFLKRLPQYTPRESVLRTLTYDHCAARLRPSLPSDLFL